MWNSFGNLPWLNLALAISDLDPIQILAPSNWLSTQTNLNSVMEPWKSQRGKSPSLLCLSFNLWQQDASCMIVLGKIAKCEACHSCCWFGLLHNSGSLCMEIYIHLIVSLLFRNKTAEACVLATTWMQGEVAWLYGCRPKTQVVAILATTCRPVSLRLVWSNICERKVLYFSLQQEFSTTAWFVGLHTHSCSHTCFAYQQWWVTNGASKPANSKTGPCTSGCCIVSEHSMGVRPCLTFFISCLVWCQHCMAAASRSNWLYSNVGSLGESEIQDRNTVSTALAMTQRVLVTQR